MSTCSQMLWERSVSQGKARAPTEVEDSPNRYTFCSRPRFYTRSFASQPAIATFEC